MSAAECAAQELRRRLSAGQSLRHIARDFGVSPSTVLRWKRELGLGSFVVETFHEHDSPAQIRQCLSCEMPHCSGECGTIKNLRS